MTSPAPSLLDDRFELGVLLAQGGMGEVYLGYDHRDQRQVAIKRVRRDRLATEEGLERAVLEGAILRATAHPNIVTVLAIVRDSTGPHIVMDYVSGGTLAHAISRDGALPLDRVLAIGLDLCDALARAHRLGIIHRDLKPENVLLAEDGSPRLTDFGIAAIRGSSTTTGPIIGTLPYLAPEGWDGEPLDELGDVWALGVVLYEMLAGRRPFTATFPGVLHAAIIASDPPDLRVLRPEIPAVVADAVTRMLVKDRARRMRSVRELAVVLERLQRDPHAPALPANSPPTSLPTPTSSLVGRAADRRALAVLLEDPGTHLITCTGPGGSGKTRLALATAADVHDRFADGAVFIDLSAITEPALVMPAIARALGVEDDESPDVIAPIVRHLASRACLLVIDNFEQVADAARDLIPLLQAAPRTRLLITSREALQIAGEIEYQVRPLAVPAAESDAIEVVRGSDAVRLFAERAQARDASFAVDATSLPIIAAICRRLDGLPLAIELAAARTRMFSVSELLGRLERSLDVLASPARDRVPRHKTIRATIAWSVDLLPEELRTPLRHLAVFEAPFTLDDALAFGIGEDAAETVDILQSLVDRHLITVVRGDPETRYGMLETVRTFGREQLADDPILATLEAAHMARFLALANDWPQLLTQHGPMDTLARYTASLADLRSALQRSEEVAPARFVAAAGRLGPFWYLAGHWQEALTWYRRALGVSAQAEVADVARVFDERGRLEMFLGHESNATHDHRQAVALAERGGDAAILARALEGLGEVLLKRGASAEATAVLERAVRTARPIGAPAILAEGLTTLATARVADGALVEAAALLEEALRVRPGAESLLDVKVQYYRAGIALSIGNREGARAACESAAAAAARTGDTSWSAHVDEMSARLAAEESATETARTLVARSLASFHAVGSRSCLPHSLEAAARVHLVASASTPDAAAAGDAALLLGAAAAICERLAIVMLPVERALLEQTTARVRETLGAAFDAPYRRGYGLPEAEAVASALAILRADRPA